MQNVLGQDMVGYKNTKRRGTKHKFTKGEQVGKWNTQKTDYADSKAMAISMGSHMGDTLLKDSHQVRTVFKMGIQGKHVSCNLSRKFDH